MLSIPILLTEKNSLLDNVKQYISNKQGGTGVIGDNVKLGTAVFDLVGECAVPSQVADKVNVYYERGLI